MAKGDLDQYLKKPEKAENNLKAEGEEGEDDEIKKASDSDDEFLLEMANFANKSCSNNVVKCSENGGLTRGQGNPDTKCSTKAVVEDYAMDLDGEDGEGGRPRVKPDDRVPPVYAEIDMFDPNDEVLFQGELMKYKAGYTPSYIGRWVQVTSKAIKYYKSRCNAITCQHKPLVAIPVAAMLKVEKV